MYEACHIVNKGHLLLHVMYNCIALYGLHVVLTTGSGDAIIMCLRNYLLIFPCQTSK